MFASEALRSDLSQGDTAPDGLSLIILCYDAAISDLREARTLHQMQQLDELHEKIRHAQDVITELLVGLDYDKGGEIAQNLGRLYNFILRQLLGISAAPGTQTYDHLISILENLKGAWENMASHRQ